MDGAISQIAWISTKKSKTTGYKNERNEQLWIAKNNHIKIQTN